MGNPFKLLWFPESYSTKSPDNTPKARRIAAAADCEDSRYGETMRRSHREIVRRFMT